MVSWELEVVLTPNAHRMDIPTPALFVLLWPADPKEVGSRTFGVIELVVKQTESQYQSLHQKISSRNFGCGKTTLGVVC